MSVKIDSLEQLESAFAAWRGSKKHLREAIPEELRARARRATTKHGVPAVVRVTRVDRPRLFATGTARAKASSPIAKRTGGQVAVETVPTFSALTLNAPTASSPRPIAEIERSGVTLRVFEQTPEMMELLSAACGFGARR